MSEIPASSSDSSTSSSSEDDLQSISLVVDKGSDEEVDLALMKVQSVILDRMNKSVENDRILNMAMMDLVLGKSFNIPNLQ